MQPRGVQTVICDIALQLQPGVVYNTPCTPHTLWMEANKEVYKQGAKTQLPVLAKEGEKANRRHLKLRSVTGTKSSKMLPLSTELQLPSPSSLAPQYAQVEEKRGGEYTAKQCRKSTKNNGTGVCKKKKKVHNEVYAAQHLTAHRNKQNTR